MFLRERSTQAEYFDTPGLSQAQRAGAYLELDRLNIFFHFSHPFVSRLPGWLGKKRCERLEILDVGAGTGLLGQKLAGWALRRGWDWRITNLDANPAPPDARRMPDILTGSALHLPFADGSFDLVVASQMTHHLTDEQIVRHWQEAWRVSRDAMFICDLHRNIGFYSMLGLTMLLMKIDKTVRRDGLISVERGFRLREWQELARRANIPDAKVSIYCGTRIVLQARKEVC